MIDAAELKEGQSVHYQPEHYKKDDTWENGVVKTIRFINGIPAVWVVYNCAGNWHEYKNYTGARTNVADLNLGWRF